MATYYALSLADINQLTIHLQDQILESPALINDSVLSELGINVITGLEYKDLQYIKLRKGGTTRPYVQGSTITSEIGKMIEREFEVKHSWNRVVENMQNFREKEPFHISPDSFESASLINSIGAINSISTEYAEDVFSALFFGKYDAGAGTGTPMDLYDGIWTIINNAITAGTEYAAAKQTIATGVFADVTDATKTDNWDAFIGFVSKLPTKLRKSSEGLVIYCSDATKTRIMDSYCRTYPALTPQSIGELGLGFMSLPNVTLVSHPILGEGNMLLATTRGNFDFGIDSLNNQNKIQTGLMQEDFNNVVFQIESTQGARVRYFDSAHLAWNGQTNTPDLTLNGDYQ